MTDRPRINPSSTVHTEPDPAGAPQYLTRGGDIVTAPDFTGTGLNTFLDNMIEGFLKQVWEALTGSTGSYDATKTAFQNLTAWAENIITGGIPMWPGVTTNPLNRLIVTAPLN